MEETFENITRKKIDALENILGKSFSVLDDGFVRVIDYMGSDASIVQAARVSYGEGTKKIRQDRELIRCPHGHLASVDTPPYGQRE
jgi:thymidylate synthase (FAD)